MAPNRMYRSHALPLWIVTHIRGLCDFNLYIPKRTKIRDLYRKKCCRIVGFPSYLNWLRILVCHAPRATAWCDGSSASPPTMPCIGLSGKGCSCPGWYAVEWEVMKTRLVIFFSTVDKLLAIHNHSIQNTGSNTDDHVYPIIHIV